VSDDTIKFDDSELQAHIAKFTRDIKTVLQQGVHLAFDMIGSRSQADYWRKIGGAPIKSKLTARSTRLIRSLSPQGGARPAGVGASEQHREVRVIGDKIVAEFGSTVEYAAIHEYGGEIKARNVKYLRFRTFDGAWHSVRKVTMPARSYLRPAAAKEQPRIAEMLGNLFARQWEK